MKLKQNNYVLSFVKDYIYHKTTIGNLQWLKSIVKVKVGGLTLLNFLVVNIFHNNPIFLLSIIENNHVLLKMKVIKLIYRYI